MHSNHDFCYCRNCGQGFSDYEFLQKHFKREHEEEIESEKLVDGFNCKNNEANDSLLSHLLKKTSRCRKVNNMSKTREGDDVEERKAKEILKNEGLGGEITVVLPCDPEDEQKVEETKSSLDDWQETEKEKTDDLCGSEIQTAPKMSLLAKISSKSKRKASQPVRVNPLKEVKTETEDDQVVTETEKIPEEEFQPLANIKQEEDKESENKLNDSASRSPSPAKSSASSDADYKLPTALPASGFWPSHFLPNAQFPHSMLATGQVFQAMAATGQVPNPSSLAQALTNPATAQAMFASGQMSSIAQALASAGRVPTSLNKTMTTASSQSVFMPPNLASAAAFMHPSFPFSQIYALQAAAALQQSKLNNNVSAANIKTEVNDTPKSESSNGHSVARSLSPDVPLDLATTSSLNAKSSNSPTSSSAGNVSDSSIRLPDDLSPNASVQEELAEDYRDSLVGMPKVQWSPSDVNSPFNWHHMTTDGRKVTSLSRTHSR
jgi:hypothetical protein